MGLGKIFSSKKIGISSDKLRTGWTLGANKVWGGLARKVKAKLKGGGDEGTPDTITELEPEQMEALEQYRKQLGESSDYNPVELAARDASIREGQIIQQSKDQEDQANKLIAQRGLSNSSVGLNAILGANRNVSNNIALSRAQRPIDQMNYENHKVQRLNSLTNGINSIFGTKSFIPGEAGGSNSLMTPIFGLGGAALGAYFGGPAGAAAGYQVGNGLGQTLQKK